MSRYNSPKLTSNTKNSERTFETAQSEEADNVPTTEFTTPHALSNPAEAGYLERRPTGLYKKKNQQSHQPSGSIT